MISSEVAPDGERAAGIVTRGLAAIIDLVVVLVIMGVLYAGWVLVRLVYSPASFSLPSVNAVFSTAVTFGVAVVYLTGCWTMSGSTAGAVAMGLRVIGRRSPRGETAGGTATCNRVRGVPDRIAVGRDRQAAKVVAGHRVPHARGLLAAGDRVRRLGVMSNRAVN